MYTYDYVKVSCNLGGWGAFGGNVYSTGNYREIINSKAKDNWRYIGFIPTKQRGTGHIAEIELIFEKKESEKK